MSLFRVGDKGKTRGGRDYEIKRYYRNYREFDVLITGKATAELKRCTVLGRANAESDDLLLPDEAEVNGGWQGGYFSMKLLREHFWTDDLLRETYPQLERRIVIPEGNYAAGYTIKLDESQRVCGLTSKVTSYTFDLSQNEVTIKDGKLIVTPR